MRNNKLILRTNAKEQLVYILALRHDNNKMWIKWTIARFQSSASFVMPNLPKIRIIIGCHGRSALLSSSSIQILHRMNLMILNRIQPPETRLDVCKQRIKTHLVQCNAKLTDSRDERSTGWTGLKRWCCVPQPSSSNAQTPRWRSWRDATTLLE